MKVSKTKIPSNFKILLVIVILGYGPIFKEAVAGITIPISRDHVGVWFNYSDCYRGPHQDNHCSKKELSTMLKVISSKFRTILIDSSSTLPSFSDAHNGTTIPHSAAFWTAGIVAEQNKAKKLPFTEVIVSFRPTEPDFSLKLAVNIIASYANQIYPKTVSTILLLGGPNGFIGFDHDGNRNHEYHSNTIWKSLKDAKTYLEEEHSDQKYRLGVTIHMDECGGADFEQNQTLVHDLLQYADTVFVLIGGTFQPLNNEAFAHLHFLGFFYECERNLHKIKENVTVIPFNIPIDERHNSLEDLLLVWGRMSDWAKENNRSVMMYEAVDDYKFVTDDVVIGSMGWWRVESDPKGGPLEGVSLIEKIHDLNTIDEDTVCGDYLTVNFDPGNETLSVEELTEMVKLVSTRFNSIMAYHGEPLETLPPYPNSPGSLWIPKIAAELNKNRNKSVLNVTVAFCHVCDSPTLSSFDVAKFMADSANEVYPGTVSTLMFQASPNLREEMYLNWSLPVLQYARTKLAAKKNKFSYSLGVFMGVESCGGFRDKLHQGFIEELLPYIDVVALFTKYYDHAYRSPPDHVLPGMKVEFDDCEKKIKHAKPQIRVVPAVYGEAIFDHPSVPQSVVFHYWGQASRWARERKEEVFVFDAFDISNLNRSTGWWTLEKGKSENGAPLRKSDFEEKFPEFWNCSRTAQKGDVLKIANRTSWEFFYMIGILCLVVIIFGGVFVWKMGRWSESWGRYQFSPLSRNSSRYGNGNHSLPSVIFRR